ncbi:MAG: cyclase family protein [Gemmataceae bacterium]
MIYDISPPISERLAVWPADTPPAREVLLDRERGDNITLSTIKATVHLGAHADAPSHYGSRAPTIDERDLGYYLGPCQVVRILVDRGACITPAMLPAIRAERVLFATGTYPDPEIFNRDFAALCPELVQHLHKRHVRLIGIDTPSVDLFESTDLPSHQMFLKYDMAILEGLVLTDVPEGMYQLIALPLRLVGFDASPVRAVLQSIESSR